MHLRRSHFDGPAIHRVRVGRGFRYRYSSGEPVEDSAVLDRIRALVIPPAWTDVWICPWPNGHIQAVGTDAAGRRQYRYHDLWRERRDAEKFKHMVEFGSALPEIRSVVATDLEQEGLTRPRVLALGIRLLDIGFFRVGGEEYAEDHESYGIATVEKRHVKIEGDSATFDYPAKGGIRRVLSVTDPVAVGVLAELKRRRGGGADLLAWRDERRWVDVRSDDVNAYLKEISGASFTAKDFRTWGATMFAAVLCAKAASPASKSARTRAIAGVAREVSELLGNTPAVCRKSYIDPRVIDRFQHGETIADVLEKLGKNLDVRNDAIRCELERTVIALLDDEATAHARLLAA